MQYKIILCNIKYFVFIFPTFITMNPNNLYLNSYLFIIVKIIIWDEAQNTKEINSVRWMIRQYGESDLISETQIHSNEWEETLIKISLFIHAISRAPQEVLPELFNEWIGSTQYPGLDTDLWFSCISACPGAPLTWMTLSSSLRVRTKT